MCQTKKAITEALYSQLLSNYFIHTCAMKLTVFHVNC